MRFDSFTEFHTWIQALTKDLNPSSLLRVMYLLRESDDNHQRFTVLEECDAEFEPYTVRAYSVEIFTPV